MIVGSFLLTRFMFADLALFWSVLAGVICGVAIGYITEVYTSSFYSSVKEIANASITGYATNILTGIAVGMKSTMWPVLLICAAILLCTIRRPIRHRLLCSRHVGHHGNDLERRRLRTNSRQCWWYI